MRYGNRKNLKYISDCDEIENLIISNPRGKKHFVKELAFQGEPYVSDRLLRNAGQLFMTRQPHKVYASLVKLKPDFTEDEFGFTALQRVLYRLQKVKPPAMVIDGDAFRDNPESTVRKACEAIDIRYDPAMLFWRNGKIREWRPGEEMSQAVWHDTLENSKGVIKSDIVLPAVNIPPKHRAWLDRAIGIYQEIVGISNVVRA